MSEYKAIHELSARLVELEAELSAAKIELENVKRSNRRALRVAEVQVMLGISRACVYRWIDEGRIPSFQLPAVREGARAAVRVWSDDLERVLTAQSAAQSAEVKS